MEETLKANISKIQSQTVKDPENTNTELVKIKKQYEKLKISMQTREKELKVMEEKLKKFEKKYKDA